MSGNYWNRTASVLSVLFVVPFAASIVLNSVAVGDGPDASRDGIRTTLEDINTNGGTYLLAWGLDVVSIIALLALAAVLYSLVRDRNRPLGLTYYGATVSGATIAMVSDVAYLALHPVASDLAEGGAGGADAATVLQVARALAWTGDLAGVAALSILGVGFVALGALIVFSPQSESNTIASRLPHWQGWTLMAGGVMSVISWIGMIDEALYIVPLLGLLAIFVAHLSLAYSLLRTPGVKVLSP